MEKMDSEDLNPEESQQLAQLEVLKEDLDEKPEKLNQPAISNNANDFEDIQFHPVLKTINEGCDHVKLTTLLIELCKDSQSQMKVMIKLLEILVNLGIDVNSRINDENETLLDLGVSKGTVLWTEFFLKNGARLTNPEPLIKLMNSESRYSQEILLLLLRYDQNITFRNNNNENLLHVVSKLNYDESYIVGIANILLNAGLPLEEPDGEGFSPLHYAVESQNFELTSFYIEKGADVNKKTENYDRTFPLFIATGAKNEKLVELLLANGADVYMKTSDEWSVLHEACWPGFERIICLYMQKGLVVNIENDQGETPFYFWIMSELETFFNDEDEHLPFTYFFVRKIANQKFASSISQCDMELIQESPNLKKHFKMCLKELSQMSKMIFYAPYSYYSVLKMADDLQKLSKLTRNKEFMKKFEANLSLFTIYKDELQSIFDEAIRIKDQAVEVELRLKTRFGENYFPDIVMRKLADNLTIEDLPLQ